MTLINAEDTTGTTGTPDSGPGTAPKRTPAISKLEGQLRDFYTQFGTYAAVMSPDPFVGMTVQANAETLSSAWADLAAQDRRVKETLERVLSGGAWAAVVGGHVVGIVVPVLAYYGRLPQNISMMVLATMLQQNQGEDGNPVLAQVLAQRLGAVPAE